MARSALLYRQDARRFREAIRPSLLGNIARLEPGISARAANAIGDWLFDVVTDTMRATSIRDENGVMLRQLRGGVRVTGRSSLATLAGSIWTYPWIFAHEYGASITPTESEYLAIPIFYGLRADGSPKYRNPRSWNRYGSFVYKQKTTGKLFLAYKSKETGELRILYVLVDKVDIPARLGLRQMGARRLGTLLAVWGEIYIQEVARAGIINLWGATR